MTLENRIQSTALAYLNSLPYCIAENVSGNASQSGRPDINGCIRGKSFRIELKTPDNCNKATKKQLLNLQKWRKSGAVVMVAYSVAFIKSVFDDNGIKLPPSAEAYYHTEANNCVSWVIIPK